MSDQDWRESLPAELAGEAMFKDIPDVATLAKVARDLKAFQGSAVRLPAADAPEAEREEFLAKLAEKVQPVADMRAKLKAADEEAKSRAAAEKSAEEELRKEWGSSFDEKLQAARTAAKAMGVPEAAVAAMPMNQVRVWAQAATKLVGNQHQVGTQGSGTVPRLSDSEIDLEIAKHRADPEYFGGRRPDLHRRVAELMAMRGG